MCLDPPRSAWLIGRLSFPGKQLAVKTILTNMPEACFEAVVRFVSEVTWEGSPWSDDSLSNKRIYPGYVYKHSKPGWSDFTEFNTRGFLWHSMCVRA